MSRSKKRAAVVSESASAVSAPDAPWITPHAAGAVLAVHAQPGAKRDAVVGEYDGKLKIALTAPPVDGKANEKLLRFLGEKTGLAKSSLELIAGDTSRAKRILFKGLSASELASRLK